ncbi:MAG: hypothetical protein SF123_09600 [Chloroflexota bacterium]|nr:hypothetical protein [Chloroflexota bacterium]
MRKRRRRFKATINGYSVFDHAFFETPTPIHTTWLLQQLEAAAALGIDISDYAELPGDPRWVDPGNPTLSKAEVVAVYSVRNQLAAVTADLQQRKQRTAAARNRHGK